MRLYLAVLIFFLILNAAYTDTALQIDSNVGNRTLILPRGATSGKMRHGFDSYITVYASASEQLKPNHEEYRLQIKFEEVRLVDCMQKHEKLQKDILILFNQMRYDEKYFRFSAPFFKKTYIEDDNGKMKQTGYLLVADLFIETPPKFRVKTILSRLMSYEAIQLKTVIQSSSTYEEIKKKVLRAALVKAKERAEAIADTFKLDLDEVQQVEEFKENTSDKLILNVEESFGFPAGVIDVKTEIKVTFEVH
jgi:uncharacterized protein YggE